MIGDINMNKIYDFLKEKHNVEINGILLHKYFKYKKFFFIIDVESDGLLGDGFCVSAIVIDIKKGEIIDKFIKMAEVNTVKNEWVKNEVIPHLNDIAILNSKLELQEEFWEFWMKYRHQSLTLTDSGSPVESYWFRQCILNDIINREKLGPFPQHDVATAVLVSGIGSVKRLEYAMLTDYPKHNPFYDCLGSVITFIKATHIIMSRITKKQD
jgi:hypothetical protein